MFVMYQTSYNYIYRANTLEGNSYSNTPGLYVSVTKQCLELLRTKRSDTDIVPLDPNWEKCFTNIDNTLVDFTY